MSLQRVSLPMSAAQKRRVPRGRSIAVLDRKGGMLEMRIVKRLPRLRTAPALTAAEVDVLTSGQASVASSRVVEDVLAISAANYRQMLDSARTVKTAAEWLRVNASRIRQRLAEGSLYGIKEGVTWRLPTFQFVKRGLVPGIDVVLKALPGGISPVAVQRWFETPNADLYTRDDAERPLTPLEWLSSGNPPEVAAALAAEL